MAACNRFDGACGYKEKTSKLIALEGELKNRIFKNDPVFYLAYPLFSLRFTPCNAFPKANRS
jgi:hypothetical protein